MHVKDTIKKNIHSIVLKILLSLLILDPFWNIFFSVFVMIILTYIKQSFYLNEKNKNNFKKFTS